eukprot:g12663.t1 g12663   contig6:2379515-2379745(+)
MASKKKPPKFTHPAASSADNVDSSRSDVDVPSSSSSTPPTATTPSDSATATTAKEIKSLLLQLKQSKKQRLKLGVY